MPLDSTRLTHRSRRAGGLSGCRCHHNRVRPCQRRRRRCGWQQRWLGSSSAQRHRPPNIHPRRVSNRSSTSCCRGLAACCLQDIDKPLDELIREQKKAAPKKKKTPAKKKPAAGAKGGTKKKAAGARKAKAGGAAGKVAAAKKKKTPAKKGSGGGGGKWKHDMYQGKGGAIKKKGGRGAATGRGRGRGGGGRGGGGRGRSGNVKETTITKKDDGTWDIKLAPGDEGKCIYVGNIPGAAPSSALAASGSCSARQVA